MLRIVTTVGTSLLMNYKKFLEETNSPAFSSFADFFNKISSGPHSEYANHEDEINSHIPALLDYIKNAGSAASAEVKSCNLILIKYPDEATICLIATDTVTSAFAAEVLRQYFNEKENNTDRIKCFFSPDDSNHVIPGLQVADTETFTSEGLRNLLKALYHHLVEGIDPRSGGTRLVNITGGFKGVIPYLTMFSLIKGFPITYVFENTNQLIEIPPLPFGFEGAYVEKYAYMLFNRRKLDYESKQELRSLGLMDEKNELTALGSLLFEYEVEYRPTSVNVIGLVIEYKLMEYYTQNPFPDYTYLERGNLFLAGEKIKAPPKGAEIDLVLKESEEEINNTNYIAVECKSARIFLSKFEKIKEQFKKKLKLMLSNATVPDEFHFFFYTFPPKKGDISREIEIFKHRAYRTDGGTNTKTSHFEELSRLLTDFFPGKKIRFFFATFELNRVYDYDNPYQSFVNEKLVRGVNFAEIEIEK
ncbi:MAG: hypothetical protein LC102_06495 [Ignavibacteriales bacterium]|jgi:putative CRISPR-associated protein, APE2256 family|nr:hypothetical protein [Ignavibacteriaceae bacterium]MBW7873320.1 hypothetical protein [Ignavibacteria bacterium]MBZ0195994.1 hypothetical protein [Ignavibacteriaceae bacterium]MCZ2143057.1 hypothetical protein [Ignavibacteriales bacterium]WKZ71799.1 MAG: hypothetical protein QY308_09225 [Ignavibacteriaceae bacterium]